VQIKLREEAMSTGASAKDLPQPGNSVNILDGPFNGLKAVFSHTDGQQIPASFTNTQIKKSRLIFLGNTNTDDFCAII